MKCRMMVFMNNKFKVLGTVPGKGPNCLLHALIIHMLTDWYGAISSRLSPPPPLASP